MCPVFREVHRWAGLPFVWGETDCIMVVCDWIRTARGVDPGADLRATYGSAAECQRVTRFMTDPLGAVAGRMEAAGLARTDTPVRGDVGLVLHGEGPGVMRPHGALCLGETWAVRAQDGVTALRPVKVIAAWGVGFDAR